MLYLSDIKDGLIKKGYTEDIAKELSSQVLWNGFIFIDDLEQRADILAVRLGY